MISLRFATPDDAADFVEIYAPAITENAASFEEVLPSIEDMRSRIERVTAKFPWLVAINSETGSVAGYAYASPHRDRASYRWSIDVSVYVREKGQGIGTQLYTQLFELVRKQRFHRAYAGITLPNEASVALHESFGFKKCALYSQVGYKFGAWHDVGWWELDLGTANGPPLEPLSIAEII